MEHPNLSYIHRLSGGDKIFEAKIIQIIKEEFPQEKEVYFKHLKEKNYSEAAENIHKLKHKISILGLEKSYEVAEKFENNLRENSNDLEDVFKTILQNIINYLNKL